MEGSSIIKKKKKKNEETIDHLLIHCAKTGVLWEMFFSLVGVSWVLPSSVKETFLN